MGEKRLFLPNAGPNRGRLLGKPIKGFVHRLIGTVAKTTSLSYAELDEALGFPPATDSITKSYVKLTHKGRGVQAAGVQDLENKVAKFLGRPAFRIVVRNLGVGTHLWKMSGSFDPPVASVAEFKPPRNVKEPVCGPFDPRGFVLVTYEFVPDDLFMGFGENFLPSVQDIEIYRGNIASYVSDYSSTPLYERYQSLADERIAFLDMLMHSRAGKLPEKSVFSVG